MQLEVWWSPAAQCWRVEDKDMFTYYTLADVIGHLKDRNADALIVPPPHSPKTDELERALRANKIAIAYTEAQP